jgi:hypothetical protein
MKKKSFFFIILFTLHFTIFPQNGFPIKVSDSKIKSLTSLVDKNLQKNIEIEIKANPQWKSNNIII